MLIFKINLDLLGISIIVVYLSLSVSNYELDVVFEYSIIKFWKHSVYVSYGLVIVFFCWLVVALT